MLTVASVNVNGIRAAFRRGMDAWLADRKPDVLALQEVRADDDHLAAHLGPDWHVVHEASEAKGRAGVAIAARWPMTAVRVGLGPRHPDTAGRWVEADLDTPSGPLTVVSVYVHKGEAGTARMAPKYAFLDVMTARLREIAADGRRAVVGGDLNIAHTERDLKNARGNAGRSGFLPAERAYLDRWLADGGWVDVARHLAGDAPGPYTWWSWRGKAFDNDAGWRIDYQLATPALARTAVAAGTDRDGSYDTRISDHAPVVVDYHL